MDSLTYGTPLLIKNLIFQQKKTNIKIKEIHLEQLLHQLNLTMNQFIDLCILLGCDYCDSIKGYF